jgi:hypothetical protein
LLRQSVFVRFAEYEDVNDAERLRHDPAMRWIVGGKSPAAPPVRHSKKPKFHLAVIRSSAVWRYKEDLAGYSHPATSMQKEGGIGCSTP